jgi:phosphoribosylformimino-5-aminoimidazole carboxamide ribotide isomerase
MKVIPVIDVRGGEVVRAHGGDRSKYELLESDLCPTGEPLPFAYALAERFKCNEIYVADLDAIQGAAPNLNLIHELMELGLTPWVDAGVHDAVDALRLRQSGAAVVVGSETVNGLDAWERIVQAIDGRRLAFSIDLRDGIPVCPFIECSSAEELVAEVKSVSDEVSTESPSRWLVLDLARIGKGEGIGTEALLENLVERYPHLSFYAGGGVRGPREVQRLDEIGVRGVLVSSAIHSGKLQPGDQSKAAH